MRLCEGVGRMNHVGVVVGSIESYLKKSFFEKLIKKVYDPIQDADIALIQADEGSPLIELIQPASENSLTYSFLKERGGGFHHICFEAESLSFVESLINEKGMKKVFGPVPAVLFDQQRVVFVYTRNHELLEFLIMNELVSDE